jgi:RimJ/RimL family protein N-acetyltransferase
MRAYSCLKRQTISCQSYAVRTIQPSDIEKVRQWRNAQMDVLRQKVKISYQEQINYYSEKIWPTLDSEKPPILLFAYLLCDQLIGYGGLVNIDWDHKRAEISFLLDPARTWDFHGYKEDFLVFLHLIKSLAFDDLSIHRLFTETYSNRIHHISVLEAAEFKLEGVLRRHVLIKDQPFDSLIHGCLKDTYAK